MDLEKSMGSKGGRESNRTRDDDGDVMKGEQVVAVRAGGVSWSVAPAKSRMRFQQRKQKVVTA